MAKGIQGLLDFQWVYKGDRDPLSDEIAPTRYALDLRTGERLTVREAQTRAHGSIPYEQRVPEGARRTYRLRELTGAGEADVRDYLKWKASQGIYLTPAEARRSEEWKQIHRGLQARSNRPGGVKSQALQMLGRRAPEWDWNVGETPREESIAT